MLRSNKKILCLLINKSHQPEYLEWGSEEKGLLLGSLYAGFLATQFPGGIIAPIIGARRLIGLAVLISAVLTIATPMVLNYGLIYAIPVRVTIGLAHVGFDHLYESAIMIRIQFKILYLPPGCFVSGGK